MGLGGRWSGAAVALCAGLLVAGGGALAQSAGAKAAHARHEGFEQFGKAFKAINDQLKAGKPNWGKIRSSAATMQKLSGQIPGWFPAGSGPESGGKTHAKAEIWSDAAGFQAALKPLAPAVAKLNVAAKAGDKAALQDAVKEAGGACGGCHKKYREKI
jgi:cytochrome c556